MIRVNLINESLCSSNLSRFRGFQKVFADEQVESSSLSDASPANENETGLQAFYKFEPVSAAPNMIWDFSGNGVHIEMSGFSPTPWGDGIEGKALSLTNK